MKSEFLAIAVLLTIGLVGGTIYNWPKPQKAVQPTPQPEFNRSYKTVELSAEQQSQFDQFTAKGDNYLAVGNQNEAEEYYNAALTIWPGNPHTLFRLGLTYYFSDQYQKSVDYLQDSVPGWEDNEKLRIVNRLMLVKAWVRTGRMREASDALIDMLLTLDGLESVPDSIKFSIGYELLLVLQNETVSAYSNVIDKVDQPAFEVCDLEPESILEIMRGGTEPTRPFEPLAIEAQLQILQRPTDDVNLTVVAGKLKSQSVNGLLNQISQKVGLQLDVSPDAQPYLTGQVVKLNSDSITLSVLLDTMLYPLGVSWMQVDDTIKLQPSSNLRTNALAANRAAESIRLGRYLLVKFNNEDCRKSIILSNANMLVFQDNFDTASAMYEQTLEDSSGGLKAKIHYNQGLISKKFNRSEDAIEQFLAAIDQSLDPAIQAAAYLHIAQIHLRNNHVKPCIIAAGRSQSLTDQPTILGESSMTLARAYLIDRDPASANRFLFENAKAIEKAGHKTMAGVYSAFARSLASLNPIDKKKATEALIIALAEVDPANITESADSLILADAYQKVSLPNQAIRILDTIIDNENESWARQRLFKRSVIQEQIDFRLAVSGYKSLAQDTGDVLGKRAALRLAEYELTDRDNPAACIDWCRTLWNTELDETTKTVALDLMGLAYRKLGDIDSSIYCFYGMLPDQPTTTKLAEAPQ